ncbi:MAG TPA: hypothetical protein VLA83_11385 [Candidatus Binatia bacterium]|nr:hypothetical protein [Candidatus Binatia bacterium]
MFTLFMFSSFGIFIALFSCVWLFLAGLGIVRQVKRGGRVNWRVVISGLFLMVGAGGFFAAGLSATGVITLPESFEWPSGYVRGVVQTQDSKYVVPHIPAGRVQLYDAQWHFIRGWHVDASGGDFTVACLPDGEIVVFTARGHQRLSFTENGRLTLATTLPESFVRPQPGRSIVVPTSPLLWIFSSPFLSWGVALIGMAGLWAARKFSWGKNRETQDQLI